MTISENHLEGNVTEMYEEGTNELLNTFTSLNKAGRFCGGLKGTTFIYKVRKKQTFEVLFRGKKRKVYFKEKI